MTTLVSGSDFELHWRSVSPSGSRQRDSSTRFFTIRTFSIVLDHPRH